MRQFSVLIFLLVLGIVASPVLHAQTGDPSDLFLNAYMSVQKAQKLEEDGKYKLALQKYKYAAGLLEQIRDKSPDWQPVIVAYRLNKTSEAIALIQKKISVEGPGPMTPDEPALPDNPETGGNPSSSAPPSPSVITPESGNSGNTGDPIDQARAEYREMKQQLEELKKKYADVEQQNTELTGKLDDTLKLLDKARVDESQTKAQLEQAEQEYKNSVAGSTRDEQGQKVLKDEVERLKNELKDRDAERDAAQDANDEAARQIASIKADRADAIKTRDEAVAALNKAKAGQEQVEKLMADNDALKEKLSQAEKTITDLNANAPAKDAEIAGLKKDLADANDRLSAALKQSQENLNAMNDLQDQLDTATTQLSLAKTGGATSEDTKKLADENALLRGIVKRERNDEVYRDQVKQLAMAELKKLQLPSDSTLADRLNDLAKPLKLTDQERALFRQTDVSISDNNISISAEKPPDEATPAPSPAQTAASPAPQPAATPVPAIAVTTPAPAATPMQVAVLATPSPSPAAAATPTTLPHVTTTIIPPVPEALIPQANEAKDEFRHGQYREAEKVYRAMMEQEPNNLYILDNLGVVLFRSGKLKPAEEILRKAIVVAPDDEFSIRTLGIVLYTEGSYDGDGALSKLTRAVTINPKDAIAHNYLGITASAKGWQEAARKELEAAVAIDPNYADAQFNLAVICLETPPVDKENARKHYKRALELGSQPDPGVEDLLNKQ